MSAWIDPVVAANVRRKVNDYYNSTGLAPTKLYVGTTEYRGLGGMPDWGEWIDYRGYEEYNYMELIRVVKQNYLEVA